MSQFIDDNLTEYFCNCCDKYCRVDGACGVLTDEQQEKCAEEDFCEWGFVNGESAYITLDYIIQFGEIKSR